MRLICACLLAVLIASPVCAQDVKSEIDKKNKAYASHDFQTLAEFYLPDAVVYPFSKARVEGELMGLTSHPEACRRRTEPVM
jgi:hypothetical protein